MLIHFLSIEPFLGGFPAKGVSHLMIENPATSTESFSGCAHNAPLPMPDPLFANMSGSLGLIHAWPCPCGLCSVPAQWYRVVHVHSSPFGATYCLFPPNMSLHKPMWSCAGSASAMAEYVRHSQHFAQFLLLRVSMWSRTCRCITHAPPLSVQSSASARPSHLRSSGMYHKSITSRHLLLGLILGAAAAVLAPWYQPGGVHMGVLGLALNLVVTCIFLLVFRRSGDDGNGSGGIRYVGSVLGYTSLTITLQLISEFVGYQLDQSPTKGYCFSPAPERHKSLRASHTKDMALDNGRAATTSPDGTAEHTSGLYSWANTADQPNVAEGSG